MTDHKELTAALDLLDSLLPDGSEGIAVLGAARRELHALTTGIQNTPPGPKPEWRDTLQVQGGVLRRDPINLADILSHGRYPRVEVLYAQPPSLAEIMINDKFPRPTSQYTPGVPFSLGFGPPHRTLWQWIVARLSKKGTK